MIFTIDDVKIPVVKCRKPKFSSRSGRTWDFGVIKINGVKIDAHLDTSWGTHIYFQWGKNNQWYKVRIFSEISDDIKGKSWDIDSFSVQKCEIIATDRISIKREKILSKIGMIILAVITKGLKLKNETRK